MKTKKLLFCSLIAVATVITSCKKDKKLETIPTVSTVIPTNVTTTTASVSGKITNSGNANVTEAGFVFSNTVAEPTTADNKIQVTNFDTFSAELTGLNSGTSYNIRAYAINSKGTGYGELRTFQTGNQAPVVSNIEIAGELGVSKTVTANYIYTDAEDDAESGTTFQWYMANSAEGSGETIIAGATAKTFVILDAQQGRNLRVAITPKAATGTIVGTEVKSTYSTAIGAETVTFTYNGVQVTYGTITSSKTGKKWLDRNLGATRVATTINDYQSFGDMFQWGRATDGHQIVIRTGSTDANATGINGITDLPVANNAPATNKFIMNSIERDWRVPGNAGLWQGVDGINNPCPEGWRIPTNDDWTLEGITTAEDAFGKMKMSYTGRRAAADGEFVFSGEIGFYWTSATVEDGRSNFININGNSNTVTIGTNPRGTGSACRCIKN